jgi:hypothetical protein
LTVLAQVGIAVSTAARNRVVPVSVIFRDNRLSRTHGRGYYVAAQSESEVHGELADGGVGDHASATEGAVQGFGVSPVPVAAVVDAVAVVVLAQVSLLLPR